MRDFRDRLHDILDAIARIELEQAKGKAAFDASPLIQVWMVHQSPHHRRGGARHRSGSSAALPHRSVASDCGDEEHSGA